MNNDDVKTIITSTPATSANPVDGLFAAIPIESIPCSGRKLNKCFPGSGAASGAGKINLFNDLPTTFAHPSVPSTTSLTKKVGAEFVGTFILLFVAAGSAIVNEKTDGSLSLVGLAATPGLAVMVMVVSIGHISGAHLNPSITVAFAALGQFPWIQVPAYVAAQVSASICASFVLRWVYHPALHGGITVPSGSNSQSFVLEFIITFILMFVVTAVATDTRAVGELAAIAIGATVMLNIFISGPYSGGSMNPVRTLGPAVAANEYRSIWVYMIGPTLGALAGAAAYTAVRL